MESYSNELIDRLPVGLYRSSQDGKLQYVNRALVEMLGYPDEQTLLSISSKDLYFDYADRIRWLERIDQERVILGFEIRLRRKNGSIIWARDTSRLIVDEFGKIYFEGSLEDITQRKTDEEALRQNEQHIQQLYEREKHISLLVQAISSTLDLNTILDAVVRLAAELVHADCCELLLLSDDGRQLIRSHQYPAVENGEEFSLFRETHVTWEIVNGAQPALIRNYTSCSKSPLDTPQDKWQDYIGVPVIAGDARLGVLSWFVAGEHPGFNEHDLTLAESVGRQAGVAIQNARLFEASQRRARELETIRQAAAAVITELDLTQVLDRILVNLKRVISYDSSALFLLEGHQLRVVGGSGPPIFQKIIGVVIPADNLLFQEALITARPIILADTSQDPRFVPWIDGYPIRSWIGIPLHFRGRVIGFLTIDSNSVNAFSEAEASLAQAFANEATIALENARLFQELQNLATTDSLTDIWNRRHLIQMAKIEFQRARRFHRPLSAILFDLDDFKNVNDTFGHSAGDQVLRGIADKCRNNLRQGDLLGRYGGEEFIVILPGTPITLAREIAERLRNLINTSWIETDLGPIRISASFGVAEMDEQCPDLDTLLKYADRAVYTAKSDGRNRVSSSLDFTDG